MTYIKRITLSIVLILFLCAGNIHAQETVISVDHNIKHQKIEGFGAALAFYENWLIAHPNKSEIYEAVFGELGLDILRVRNAHDYDAGMIGRVKEFIDASEKVNGSPIPFLSTSWGPPAYLKSNNDKSNGGTLKYSVSENGDVIFDYEGFANWWNSALDEYETNGLYPTYISIQNEPDYLATWESCLFHFFERVNSTDTIAGYNKALEVVHEKISKRTEVPKFLGPESIGLGYDALRRYLLHADTSLLDGVAFHLYHGVNPQNPWSANEFGAASEYAPEIPYFQTEYEGGGWFNTAGLIYNALVDANVVSYFYWDLIWDKAGLVSLDNPWNRSSWSNSKGYTKTKEFYAFKQFSAFVHNGWQRIDADLTSNMLSAVAFTNPGGDTTSVVIINRSSADEFEVVLNFEDFEYTESKVYHTSLNYDCEEVGGLIDSKLTVPVQSITTIELVNNGGTNKINEIEKNIDHSIIYPNPFNQDATLIHSLNKNEKLTFTVFDINGKTVHCEKINGGSNKNSIAIYRKDLRSGLYFYILEDNYGNHNKGKLHIID